MVEKAFRLRSISPDRICRIGHDVSCQDELIDVNLICDSEKPSAAILSYTGVSSEPRVLRQSAALESDGWVVSVFGFKGKEEVPESWDFYELPIDNDFYPLFRRVCYLGRGLFGFLGNLSKRFGWFAYFTNVNFYNRQKAFVEKASVVCSERKFDLILTHDYFTLPAAFEFGDKFGIPVVMDAHEYAMGQYMHSFRWRAFERPVIRAIQEELFPRLAGMTTVSQGICDLLNKEYELAESCITVRSIPPKFDLPVRETGDRVRVLYHGNVDYVRGLHKAIQSIPSWPENFDFIIRGTATPGYLDELKKLASELGVSERVTFVDAVPFVDLIRSASEADVGYFVHKDLSPQKRFVLPNKFFEYIQAGLALCVSDLPSMAEIVQEYDLGVLVDGYSEESISEALSHLSKEKIDNFRANSAEARKTLCWEKEAGKMVAYYRGIIA